MTELPTPSSSFEHDLKSAFAWPVAKRSLIVAVLVGTVLNLLNQGDYLMAGSEVNWLKVGLTYCVPFCVASYGAFSAFRAQADKKN